MSIDFDKFLSWAESRFDDVRIRGDEILLNSVFCEDRKHHLWCNPSGGKTGSTTGVFHCWKSNEKGSLVKLVMHVDGCTYEQALERLDAIECGTLADLERKVQEIFAIREEEKKPEPVRGLELPPDCYLIEDLPSTSRFRQAAEECLKRRKIDSSRIRVCTSGRYRNRILIPYLNREGVLVYYNGRQMDDQGPKYLGPPKELGIGKGDVLFVPEWPESGSKVYITEGEFDAMSLFSCGFPSAALGGKEMSDTQFHILKDFIPVLCLDADEAGGQALLKMADKLLSRGVTNVFYVRPCKEYKDWNGLLVEKGERILKHYVASHERRYQPEEWEGTRIAMNRL